MPSSTSNADFSPVPSIDAVGRISVAAAASAPASAAVVGLLVAPGESPVDLAGVQWAQLEAIGFDGAVGSTAVLPGSPVRVAVGIGPRSALSAVALRDAGGAFGRATRGQSSLAIAIAGTGGVPAELAAQSLVEGTLLSRYRYDALRRHPKASPVSELTIVAAADDQAAAAAGAARGTTFASATMLARDLANSPHSHLTAVGIADLAVDLASSKSLTVEVFDKEALVAMGCGGLLGVNAGSAEPPRMVKMTYRPAQPSTAHLSLVGKGIMYDSGGLSLKPGDEVHAQMKNDMSGAAAVFAAMATLADAGCTTAVTAFLMCTDNMPSGTAMALGDVITMRGGTTVEVINTDAEGRLIMADALVLASEEPTDAIIDIATLTGACMRALGTKVAGVIGNNQALVEQIRTAADTTDEPVWQLPLEQRYRNEIQSEIADLKNLGSSNGGAIHAALFLAEFVGDVPWAHIDIAGTAQTPADTLWHTAGCSGFGARLLVQLALDFQAPAR